MNYSLHNLLQTYPFNEMQIIAGSSGLDNLIFFAGVLDAPDSVRFVREGEFVLTSGYIFGANKEALIDIIEELHQRKAAALGIKMFRYIQNIPDEARTLADEYNLPLLLIPNKFSWHDIIKPLVLNVSAAMDSDSPYVFIYNQLINNLRQCLSVGDVLNTAGTLLQYPLTVINIETLSTLHYPPDFQFPIVLDHDFLQKIFNPNLVMGNGNVRYYHQIEPREIHLFVANLDTKDYQLLIIWDAPSPEQPNKFNSLMYSGILISETIHNLRNKQRNLIHKKNTLLCELFENKHPIYRKDAAAMHIDPDIQYVPAIALLTTKSKGSADVLSIFDPPIHNRFEQLTRRYNIHACLDEHGVFHFLIPTNELWDTQDDVISYSRQYGRRIQKLLGEAFPDRDVQLLIGFMADSWEDIQNKHQEIFLASDLLKEKRFRDRVTHIHDLGAAPLLLNPEIASKLPAFYAEYFSPILKLETNIRMNILETLKTYIEVGFSFREAGRVLNVHHNTIRYRLEQFSNLTGLEITHQEDLLIILICLYFDKQ
ncbi:purine catabolism regulatory protein [Bacteroidia bacterium]|nr:purine catabolism regulatory protein [Bacteroidia bacterium]